MDNTVKKNRTGQIGHRQYTYVDIAQINEYLVSINASYYQYIDRVGDDDYVMTVKILDGKEQAPLRGCRVVDATLLGSDNPAQLQGSALTYARRYSLLMAFGLATEDDDAQSLTQEKKPEVKKEPEKASVSQVEMLRRCYRGDNLEKLLQKNNIEKLEDISAKKAYELIKAIREKSK